MISVSGFNLRQQLVFDFSGITGEGENSERPVDSKEEHGLVDN